MAATKDVRGLSHMAYAKELQRRCVIREVVLSVPAGANKARSFSDVRVV